MKMKHLLASCALLALPFRSPHTLPAAGSHAVRSTRYCTSTQFSQSDRDLNDEYGRLRKQLSGDQQATLKAGQLAWLKQRDAQCSETRNNSYLVDIQCANDMTQSRLSFLRERERECSSTGCVTSKLGE